MFGLIYFGLLLVGSSAAAYYNHRTPFMLGFSLLLISIILFIVGGEPALRTVATAAGLLLAAGLVSYGFKEFLIQIAEGDAGAFLRGGMLFGAGRCAKKCFASVV